MKLSIIEEALKMYEARGDHDDQTQADIANFINAVHTEDYLTEISNLILADAFDFLHDLWSDNEALGDNNPDGTFKRN